ncbi:MAG: alpha/beta fold hydrolase [Anaerolineales bacterium]|nr:alpha/beta fold hydrolase [Anaerolineales bacterium]
MIILVTVITLFLAACSAGNPSPTAPPTPEHPTSTPMPPTAMAAPTTELPAAPRPTVDMELVLTPITTVEYDVDSIDLQTSDGVQISAKQFGTGELAVVLAHQGIFGSSQHDWENFAKRIAARGYSAVTLDFRGHGLSQGDSFARNNIILDMRALIDYLHEEGYDRIVCIGASMGGTTCLRAAVEYDLVGVVVIGSLMDNGEPTKITDDELAALTIPKLFITTENDQNNVPETMKHMYEASQEPKLLRVFPGEAHGTYMFYEPYRDEFTAELLAFLETVR